MRMDTGSCICGKVGYRMKSERVNVVNCHCNACRKRNGSMFSSYAAYGVDGLEIIGDRLLLGIYESAPGRKYFCSNCGTPLFNLLHAHPGLCMIYLGTLEQAETVVPEYNLWCESKPEWVDRLAEIPSLPREFD